MAQTQLFKGPNRAVLFHSGSPGFPGCTDFILHLTAVVKKFEDGRVQLNTGGHRTATTQRAMNQVANQYKLGFTVRINRGNWEVCHGGKVIPFSDRMELTQSEEKHD